MKLDSNRLAYVADHVDAYVNAGKIPCAAVLIRQGSDTEYCHVSGFADVERNQAATRETLFRIYSMTKPITSVALLMLYERGCFQLDDPVAKHIPAWADKEVYVGGEGDDLKTVPCESPMTIQHLMTHTSGLTYGFMRNHPIDALYRKAGLEREQRRTLKDLIDGLAKVPLLFQPGTKWSYSVATDVLGYLVEHFSGQPFDEFIRQNVTAPLGMRDTGFSVPTSTKSRLAACYSHSNDGYTLQDDPTTSRYLTHPTFFSGGGGLVSTLDDYMTFARNLMDDRPKGAPELLSPATAGFMASNHLPNNADLADMGQAVFSETSFEGVGFGLSGSVVINPAKSAVLDFAGSYGWGGAASTYFWNDPANDISTVFMTQLLPSSTWPIRRELKVLVNQALR